MNIGVLALQGDFKNHANVIRKLGAESLEVKTSSDLDSIDGLILPGGESTSIGRFLSNNIGDKIIERYNEGMPIYGTCAGAILLAKHIKDSAQYRLGLVEMTIERNAYGSQANSFEKYINIPVLGDEPYNCIFIRAPAIKNTNKCEILAYDNNDIIMLRNDKILVTTFHPELTDDLRVHKYFIDEFVRK